MSRGYGYTGLKDQIDHCSKSHSNNHHGGYSGHSHPNNCSTRQGAISVAVTALIWLRSLFTNYQQRALLLKSTLHSVYKEHTTKLFQRSTILCARYITLFELNFVMVLKGILSWGLLRDNCLSQMWWQAMMCGVPERTAATSWFNSDGLSIMMPTRRSGEPSLATEPPSNRSTTLHKQKAPIINVYYRWGTNIL